MTVLYPSEGGTGITPINGYVLVPASNCAPTNNNPGLIGFLGGFFVIMLCLIVFYYVVVLAVKLLGLDDL